MSQQKIFGRRAVFELLESEVEISEIFLLAGGKGSTVSDIRQRAEQRGIRVVPVCRTEIERIATNMNHQGVVAICKLPKVLSVDELIAQAGPPKSHPIIVLDGVEDPQNLGAIVRSADVFGAGGVIIRRRRAATLSPVVVKTSAGAALRLAIAEVPNIDHAIRQLKANGYWIYGLDSEADLSLWEADLTDPLVFVLGGEGAGLSRLVSERCDRLLSIPQRGNIASLNVSVTAAVALAEWSRQVHAKSVN